MSGYSLPAMVLSGVCLVGFCAASIWFFRIRRDPNRSDKSTFASAILALISALLAIPGALNASGPGGSPATSASTEKPALGLGEFRSPAAWSGERVVSSGCERNIAFAPVEYAPAGTRYALVLASVTSDGTPETWYVQPDWNNRPNSPVLTLDAIPVGDGDPAGTRFQARVFAVPDAAVRPLDTVDQPSVPPGWLPASPLIELKLGPESRPCS